MPKPTVRKSRKSVKSRTMRKTRSNTKKGRKTQKISKNKMNGGSENEKDANNLNIGNTDFFAHQGNIGTALIEDEVNECEHQKAENNIHEYRYNEDDGECEYKLKQEFFNEEKQKCLSKNKSKKSHFSLKKNKKKTENYIFDETTGECKTLKNWGTKNNQAMHY